METEEKCYKVVQQSSTGITADKLADKVGIHRTTAHRHLNSLEIKKKVYSEHGVWFAKEDKSVVSGKLLSEIKSEFMERMWNIYGKIVALHINPEQRYRENGSQYYYRNTSEIIKLVKILAEMHPSLKAEIVRAIKNSEREYYPFERAPDTATAIKNLGRYITPSEFDQLIGKLGRVLHEIEMKGVV